MDSGPCVAESLLGYIRILDIGYWSRKYCSRNIDVCISQDFIKNMSGEEIESPQLVESQSVGKNLSKSICLSYLCNDPLP